MPRRSTDPARTVLVRQRQTAERLRREVMRLDGSLGHPYFKRFERYTRDYLGAVTRADVVAAAAMADIVYVGDFHAVPTYQHSAAELLESLTRRMPRLALGIEFVYTRQQRLLDLRQRGTLGDEAFLRRIRYEAEWSYPWPGFRELLDRARALAVEVHALDAPPRGGFSTLVDRDSHAARRIAKLVLASPDTRLLIFFGETHLAPSHLPRRVKSLLKQAGVERREVVVLQNPDRVYWKVLAREPALPRAVQVDDRTYALFHTSPLQKYEAYRQALDGAGADSGASDDADLTSAVHHLLHELLRWLGIRATRRRLRHRAGWSDDLIDAFPEVYSGSQARELLTPILLEHGRTTAEVDEARRRLGRRGAYFEARSNALFVRRYLPGPTAGECARFLRAALTGRLYVAADDFADNPTAAAYAAAYGEALALLGASLIDPGGAAAAVEHGPAVRPASSLARWLERHRAFEASRRRLPPLDLAERMRRSRPLRRAIARDVGGRLGRSLYDRVRAGAMPRSELRRLFTRRLAPEQAMHVTLGLLRSTRVARAS